MTLKIIQAIALDFGCPADLESKILLLKTTLDVDYTEIDLELN